MKKLFLIITAMVGMANAAQAQLKLHSNGNLSFQNIQTDARSPMSLGHRGDYHYFMSYWGDLGGLKVQTYVPADSTYKSYAGYFFNSGLNGKTCTGVRGMATANSNTNSSTLPSAIGLEGVSEVASSYNGFSYSVYGLLDGSKNGAALCGKSNSTSVVPDGRYAGFFIGPTKMNGNLTVTGTIQGTLLGRSASAETTESTRSISSEEPVTDRLSSLNTMVFSYPQSENIRQRGKGDSAICELENIEDDTEDFLLEEQIQDKLHYALSAEELEKVFPELVYEEKDGSKGINYVEMIPLLVKCINELQSQIRVLENEGNTKKAPSATQATNATSFSKAILYQNTPNPFSERTEIRFSLPEDAHDAAICIFDMTGKMMKKMPISSGETSVSVNGWELGEGMFLYSLVVGGREIDTKRMILSK